MEAGSGAGAGEGAGAGAGVGVADGACDVLATGSEVTGLEETGAPRPERARWTGGADTGCDALGARLVVTGGGTGLAPEGG